MSKLKQLKPRIATLPPRLPSLVGTKRPGSVGVRWNGRKLTEWRKRILSMEPLCRHCRAKGLTTVAAEVDHLVPLEQGGGYEDANAQPLCTPCHKAKSALEASQRAQQGTRGGGVG